MLRKVEDVLIKSGLFNLPGKKIVQQKNTEIEIVVMKQSYWIALPLILGLVNCHPSKPLPANVTNCATVVQNYLGFTDPVAVTKSQEFPSTQQVIIEYQSQNDENIVVNGIATCVFSAPNAERDRLLNATINNQPLTKEEITALNQQVDFSH